MDGWMDGLMDGVPWTPSRMDAGLEEGGTGPFL